MCFVEYKGCRNLISYETISYIIITVRVPRRCSSWHPAQVAYLSTALSKFSHSLKPPQWPLLRGRFIILGRFDDAEQRGLLMGRRVRTPVQGWVCVGREQPPFVYPAGLRCSDISTVNSSHHFCVLAFVPVPPRGEADASLFVLR